MEWKKLIRNKLSNIKAMAQFKIFRISLLIVLCFGFTVQAKSGKIITFEVPEGLPTNTDFEVFVKSEDSPIKKLFSYEVQVDAHKVQKSSMVRFDFENKVSLAVVHKNGSVKTVRIRPLSYNIKHKLSGDTIFIDLEKPLNLSLEVNGNLYRNLHIFTNRPETNRPSRKDKSVIFLDNGIHNIDSLCMKNNQTLYLSGGAVLKGKIVCNKVKNVKIMGRGIVYQGYRGVEITHSEDVILENLIFINPTHYTVYGGQSKNLQISGIRSFSSRGWSDGIDMMSCSDVIIENVFMRNSDDCIALYGHRWNFYGDSRNIIVQNSTLWADVAHPIMIGTHGNYRSGQSETLENYTFRNIDILNHDEMQINYQGCIAINVSDENLARNMLFENIRIEDFQQGQLLNIRVTFNKKYAMQPGRGIEDITFRNVVYKGENAEISVIEGYSENRMVKNILFEGLKINGVEISPTGVNKKHMKYSDFAKIYEGNYVENIVFKSITPQVF